MIMYTLDDVKKVQQRLLEMAVAIRDILENHNVPYFITYGTLLGAVRHQGFIPWDDDFDFYILAEDYNDAMKYLKEELPASYFLENEESEDLYFHGWAHVKDLNSVVECSQYPQDSLYRHKGISVDLYKATQIKANEEEIFRIEEHLAYLKRKLKNGIMSDADYNVKVDELNYKLALALSNKSEDERLIYAFPSIYNDRLFVGELFPLRRYKFEDVSFYGPNNADIYLTRCYGDYMKLPPIEKRVPHYSSVLFLN